MSWGGWSARLNVTSIVSQGLEQVSKLREDVEKQFDQAVLSTKATTNSSSNSSAAAALDASVTSPASAAAAPEAGKSTLTAAPQQQQAADDILVRRAAPWGAPQLLQSQPPYSADGKQRRTHVASPTPAPLSFARTTKREAAQHEEEKPIASSERSGDGEGVRQDGEAAGVEEAAATVSEDDEAEPQIYGAASAFAMEGSEQDGEASAVVKESDSASEAVALDEPSGSVATPEVSLNVSDGGGREGEKGSADAIAEPPGINAGTSEVVDGGIDSSGVSGGGDTSLEYNTSGDAAPKHESPNEGVSAAGSEIASLRQHLEAREAQLLATSATIQELHNELDKTCQREVAAVERARFLTEQLELMRVEVAKLNRMASGQRDSDLQAMQAALSEKDEKLKGLLEEGQALSVKQAQLEQRVRQLRKEKNEEEEQRTKLQAQLDAVSSQLQEQTAKLKLSEEEKKKCQQELRQLQSSTDANSKRLAKAEQNAASFETQVQQLRAQVDQLSQRNDELEKEVAEAQEMSHSNAALSGEKAELEHTIHFLHHSLQDLESEATRREESARAEIQDLKRKWQEAVSRVDLMGQSVTEATQPLLRQINALQDDQRARQETWKATEATLLQRLRDANDARRAVEDDKLERDDHIHRLQSQIEVLEQEARRRASELVREKEKAASAASGERELHTQLDAALSDRDEWKSRAQSETSAREQLQLRLNNERKLGKRTESDTEATGARGAELEALRARAAQLSHDLEWHQNEVRRLKAAAMQQNGGVSSVGSSRGARSVQRGSVDSSESAIALASAETQASILTQSLEVAGDDVYAGSASVLGMSQLQQRLRLKESENRLVKQQLLTLEAKQSQLTEEIVRLSTRNALLETNEARFQQTQEELQELRQRQHVLLELFGEKEEQVEELQAEVSELKAFYRKQLDTLANHHEQQR